MLTGDVEKGWRDKYILCEDVQSPLRVMLGIFLNYFYIYIFTLPEIVCIPSQKSEVLRRKANEF